MDFSHWWKRAQDAFAEMAKAANLETVNMEFDAFPKESRWEDHGEAATLLPEELMAFFKAAQISSCNIEYKLRLEQPYRIKSAKLAYLPRVIRFGIQILSIERMMAMRENMARMIRAAHPAREKSSGTALIEDLVPLSQLDEGDFFVYVKGDRVLSPGIYLIFYGGLLGPRRAIKYCDTFAEWLAFLENDHYLFPDWSYMEPFHNGRKLVARKAINAELTALIG